MPKFLYPCAEWECLRGSPPLNHLDLPSAAPAPSAFRNKPLFRTLNDHGSSVKEGLRGQTERNLRLFSLWKRSLPLPMDTTWTSSL